MANSNKSINPNILTGLLILQVGAEVGEEVGAPVGVMVGEDALDFLGCLVGGGLILNTGSNLGYLNLLQKRRKKC